MVDEVWSRMISCLIVASDCNISINSLWSERRRDTLVCSGVRILFHGWWNLLAMYVVEADEGGPSHLSGIAWHGFRGQLRNFTIYPWIDLPVVIIDQIQFVVDGHTHQHRSTPRLLAGNRFLLVIVLRDWTTSRLKGKRGFHWRLDTPVPRNLSSADNKPSLYRGLQLFILEFRNTCLPKVSEFVKRPVMLLVLLREYVT